GAVKGKDVAWLKRSAQPVRQVIPWVQRADPAGLLRWLRGGLLAPVPARVWLTDTAVWSVRAEADTVRHTAAPTTSSTPSTRFTRPSLSSLDMSPSGVYPWSPSRGPATMSGLAPLAPPRLLRRRRGASGPRRRGAL